MATKKIVIDVHAEIDFNLGYYSSRDVETQARRLEDAAKDFMWFIKDHRSQDVNNVRVVREFGYKCEHCGWVYDHDEEKPECCEKAIREWATKLELISLGFEEA